MATPAQLATDADGEPSESPCTLVGKDVFKKLPHALKYYVQIWRQSALIPSNRRHDNRGGVLQTFLVRQASITVPTHADDLIRAGIPS